MTCGFLSDRLVHLSTSAILHILSLSENLDYSTALEAFPKKLSDAMSLITQVMQLLKKKK